jgi:hypothetical protein
MTEAGGEGSQGREAKHGRVFQVAHAFRPDMEKRLPLDGPGG